MAFMHPASCAVLWATHHHRLSSCLRQHSRIGAKSSLRRMRLLQVVATLAAPAALPAVHLGPRQGKDAPRFSQTRLSMSQRQAHEVPAAQISNLLCSREFVRDMARLAEQIVMHDLPLALWTNLPDDADKAAEVLASRLTSRQSAAFFAPDKLGHVKERPSSDRACAVRAGRAAFAVELQRKYSAKIEAWIDTPDTLEKQCSVLTLHSLPQRIAAKSGINPSESSDVNGAPIVVVAFRGSKGASDYLRTDVSPYFVPVAAAQRAADAADMGLWSVARAARHLLPFAPSTLDASVTWGLWCSYAGCRQSPRPETQKQGAASSGAQEPRNGSSHGGQTTCRALVRETVEKLLLQHGPRTRLVLTGHSLGAALATLCAYDLLTSPLSQQASETVLLAFAPPRFFNLQFNKELDDLQAEGKLHALRVEVAGDVVPHIPPRRLGAHHGITARVLLDPRAKGGKISYASPKTPISTQSGLAWPHPHAHTSHAILLQGDALGGESKARCPLDLTWPVGASNDQSQVESFV